MGKVNLAEGVDRTQTNNNVDKTDGGKFKDAKVRTESKEAEPSKFRETLASVKLFFQSLFGIKVSTPDAEPVDRASAGKHLMSEMTKKNTDLGDILIATSKFAALGQFALDVDGGETLEMGAKADFSKLVGGLNDMQLLRLARTLEQQTDLLSNMTKVVHQHAETFKDERGAGGHKAITTMTDATVVMRQLAKAVNSEFEKRDFDAPRIDWQSHSSRPTSENFGKLMEFLVRDGGSLETAVQKHREGITSEKDRVVLQQANNIKENYERYW